VSENPLERLQAAGVSIWLDTLSRELLESGDFASLNAKPDDLRQGDRQL
jgi:hypothetical protein